MTGENLERAAKGYPTPPLRDEQVSLRPWSETDLGCVEEASRDGDVSEGTTVPRRFTAPRGLAFIERQHQRLRSGEGLVMAIAEASTDRAVGLIGIFYRSRPAVAGVGYWLVKSARGRGLAGRALKMLVPWALRDHGLHRIEALVEVENHASRQTLRRAGFNREALLRAHLDRGGRRTDALLYVLTREDLSNRRKRLPDRS